MNIPEQTQKRKRNSRQRRNAFHAPATAETQKALDNAIARNKIEEIIQGNPVDIEHLAQEGARAELRAMLHPFTMAGIMLCRVRQGKYVNVTYVRHHHQDAFRIFCNGLADFEKLELDLVCNEATLRRRCREREQERMIEVG